MPARRRISKGGILLWFFILAGAWLAANNLGSSVDSRLFNLAARALGTALPGKPLHLLHPGETAPPEPDSFRETRQTLCPTVGMVSLNDDAVQKCFAALPLGPQDLAVLLSNLSAGGVRTLGVSSPLSWQEPATSIAQQMICLSLSHFSHAAIGLRGRTASQADFTPTVLRQNTIPADQVEGDTTGLPSANKALPNDLLYAAEASHLAWVPDWMDEEPLTQKAGSAADRSYPLLARWNGEIMPTLPLCLALKAAGCSVEDVHVRMGQDIRIGKKLLFPLDEHGRTRLTHARTAEIALADVVRGSGESLKPLGRHGLAILEQPGTGQTGQGRLQLLAATLSQLCARDKVERHRIPGAAGCGLQATTLMDDGMGKAVAAVALLLILRFLPTMPAFIRRLALATIPCCIIWQVRCGVLGGYWFPVTAYILAWLLLFPALRFLVPVDKGIFRTRRK